MNEILPLFLNIIESNNQFYKYVIKIDGVTVEGSLDNILKTTVFNRTLSKDNVKNVRELNEKSEALFHETRIFRNKSEHDVEIDKSKIKNGRGSGSYNTKDLKTFIMQISENIGQEYKNLGKMKKLELVNLLIKLIDEVEAISDSPEKSNYSDSSEKSNYSDSSEKSNSSGSSKKSNSSGSSKKSNSSGSSDLSDDTYFSSHEESSQEYYQTCYSHSNSSESCNSYGYDDNYDDNYGDSYSDNYSDVDNDDY